MPRRILASGYAAWSKALAAAAILACALQGGAADKAETWVAVHTAHLTVYSDGGEKTARRIATQFEQIRDVFLKGFPGARVDPGQPILILAAKDEKSLAVLLPEYFEQKGRAHPAGLFSPGTDRNYVALRTDVPDEDLPYHTLYHEYTHQVEHLNLRVLPVWLSEGYAEFFGKSRIVDRRVTLGWAPPADIEFLQQQRILPLEQLFRVDNKSPYYNEANKVNIFYAESWALVHMLFFDPQYEKGKALDTYIHLVNDDVDSVEAARRAFGDLANLQRNLEAYIRGQSFHYLEMVSPIEEIQKNFTVETMAEAEMDAVIGGFYLAHGRTAEATKILAQAAKLDPNSAAANEELGLLHLQLDDREAAAPYFERAVQMNSQSFLAYYYHAEMILGTQPNSDATSEAEKSLEKCTALNPNFAAAYAGLAQIYLRQNETLDKALKAARTAVSLDPSSWRNELTLASTMARLNQFDPARAIVNRIAATATEPGARDAAVSVLQFIAQTEQYNAGTKGYGAPPAARERTQTPDRPNRPLTLGRRTEGGGTGPAPTTGETQRSDERSSEAAIPAAPAAPSGRIYSMTGKIAAAACASQPAVMLTVTMGGITMKLHAEDLSKVSFSTAGGPPQGRAPACGQLAGISAHVSYTLTDGKPYDGEIRAIDQLP